MSLETYFAGRFSAIAALPAIQCSVEGVLPNLYVPHDRDDEAAALRPYQLRNDAGTRSLALAINQATYIAFKEYPGYEEFEGEAVPVLLNALKHMEVDCFTRVVFRYDNAITLGRNADGEMDLGSIIRMDVPDWIGASGHRTFAFESTRTWEEGETLCKIFHEPADGQEALRIVIAATETKVADLESSARRAHERAWSVFDSMITDQYREWIAWDPKGTS